MRVLLVNGSPREAGCTYTALMEVAGALERSGVEWEMFQAGAQPIRGCTGCGRCRQTGGKCVFSDRVIDLIDRAQEADGFVFGTPVHYAAASGAITSLLDRAFYANSAAFCGKPAGVIASCRRAGSTAALEQLTKYPTISQMPVVSSQYWPMVHGNSPEEVRRDLEGMQTMRVLAVSYTHLTLPTNREV